MLLSADHQALIRSGPTGQTAAGRAADWADRGAIHDLVALYAHRVTHGLSVADLFVDDGAYIHRRRPGGEAQVHRGRAELDAHYVERKDSAGAATPMIHNVLSRVDGNQAIALVSIELRLWRDEQSVLASGFYQDRLRREGEVWKFFERDVTFFHWAA
jgi:hypothetical protein